MVAVVTNERTRVETENGRVPLRASSRLKRLRIQLSRQVSNQFSKHQYLYLSSYSYILILYYIVFILYALTCILESGKFFTPSPSVRVRYRAGRVHHLFLRLLFETESFAFSEAQLSVLMSSAAFFTASLSTTSSMAAMSTSVSATPLVWL